MIIDKQGVKYSLVQEGYKCHSDVYVIHDWTFVKYLKQ